MDAGPAHAFGVLLRRYRGAAGLTQEELAERAGLSARGIGDLERGARSVPHRDTLERLADALGLTPAERTLFDSTRRRTIVGDATPGSRSSRASPVFVGREQELAALERHLAGEEPPALFFAGEPGIGKSRLLGEARQRAAAQGWQILAGGCLRPDAQEPYTPLLQALAAHVKARPPAQLRADLRGCAWLVRLLPELASGPIEPLPAWALPPEQERRLMIEAVRRFVANVASPAGTLLLLDDLQWAVTDALDLLAALLDAPAAPVRLVGAYRTTEVGPRHPLAAALAGLANRGLVAHRALDPLAPSEVRQLLANLLDGGATDAPALVERLVQRTGGLPFFVVSCAQAIRQGASVGVSDDPVPWDAAQSIRQRVALLPEPGQAVLGLAALIGREVRADLLVAATEHDAGAVLSALEAATQARLLQENEPTYRFAHDLIREVVEADVGMARRRSLHRRIAEVLEQDAGEQAAEALAYHYDRAGLSDQALRYRELAGDHAWTQHANGAAEDHYRRLVASQDQLGRTREAARAREKLGALLLVVGRLDEALDVLEQAAQTCQELGDQERLASVTATIGTIGVRTGTAAEGAERLRFLVAKLEARGPSRGLVELYASLARLLFTAGRYRDDLLAAERAVELGRIVGDQESLARALWCLGVAHLVTGRLTDAQRDLEAAIAMTGLASDPAIRVDPPLILSLILLRRGDLEQSAHWCQRGLDLAGGMGYLVYLTAGTTRRSIINFVRGDWARARRDGEQAHTWGRQLGWSWAARRPLTALGLLCYGEGRWEEARRYLEERMAVIEGHQPGEHVGPGVLAEIAIREGRADQAAALLSALLDVAAESSMDVSLLLAPYAWAQLELGEVAAATATLEQAIAYARAEGDRLALVDALRVLALVALRQGQRDAAEAALTEGLALAQAMPYPFAEGRLLHLAGLLHQQKGEPEPAREQWGASLVIFRCLGAQREVEEVERQLAHTSP